MNMVFFLLVMGMSKALRRLWTNGVVVGVSLLTGFWVGYLASSFLWGVLATLLAYLACCAVAVADEMIRWGG